MDLTDEQLDAIWSALIAAGTSPPYMARADNFTAEQVRAGELRAADREADELNRAVLRGAIAGVLSR